MIELKPIRETTSEYDQIEKKIKELFKHEIYIPLLAEFYQSSKKLKNSQEDLYEALRSGRLTFNRGCFSGKLNSTLSGELRRLGAKWNKTKKCYTIPKADLPHQITGIIQASESAFVAKIQHIDRKLASVVPEQLADKLKIDKIFDRTLWKVEKEFQQSVKNITVSPKLTDDQAKRLADEWQNNMKLWIKDFTEKEIKQLRTDMQKSIFAGNRYESAIKGIQKSYDVTANKAKFLARQETALAITSFKEIRYQDAGVNEYKWRSVKGTPLHPVRPMHKELNDRSDDGEIFRFDQPPIDDPNGSRHNPGRNYNCLPGNTLVRFNQSILKIFRRRFSGEMPFFVTNNNVTHESTGNHPILTNRGWVASKDIQIGDYVFEGMFKNTSTHKMNTINMEALIEDVFNALSLCSEITNDVLTKSDFHGDVTEDKNVDIISIDRELIFSRISKLYEMIQEFLLKGTSSHISIISSINKTLSAWRLTSHSLVSFSSELLSFLKRHTFHSNNVGIRTGTFGDSEFFQPSSDNNSFNSIFDGDCKFTHPFLVILDSLLIDRKFIPGNDSSDSFNFNSTGSETLAKNISVYSDMPTYFGQTFLGRHIKPLRVIDTGVRNFRGHVFNLETSTNWYYAKDIILSNCRCVAIPIVRFRKTS